MKKELAIAVQNVSKSFKLPHEKHSGLKQAVINFRPGKKYEVQHVLKNVSLNIEQGDFYGISGRNGSGKSTLLKLLAQIYDPDGGSIKINGSLTPFIELGVGFNAELTGRDNVFLNGALLGFDRTQVGKIYDQIVKFAELERFMDQKLKNYSSGMQVRLAFSIAIHAQSDILLVDEVLAVGDAAFQQKCYNYFEQLKREKRTVVFVSHDMGAVQRFCTKAVYIKDGEIVQRGTPSQIADLYSLENIETEHAAYVDSLNLSKRHHVTAEIVKQTSRNLTVLVNFESPDQEPMFVGLGVSSQGISIAEINTLGQMDVSGSGTVTYTLDTTAFNPGVYELSVVLYRLKNRELVSAGRSKSKFSLKGDDPSRGGPLVLTHTWKRG